MHTMHLFAGAGGGLLADLILGHTPVVAVEWEPYACAVLRERVSEGWFPDMRVWEGDVREFDPSEYKGRVDCVHAGFPCQDISTAGKQAGLAEGTRSGLYREVLRIARIIGPRYIFLENVAAITSKGLDQVIKDLAEMGYDGRWCCLRASDVGANHQRDRWWALFITNPVCSDGSTKQECQHQRAEESGGSSTREVGSFLADSDSTQCERGWLSSRTHEEYPNFGSDGWWEVEPDVGRVADGLASRMDRLKAIGNGQVPLQAAAAFKILSKGWV